MADQEESTMSLPVEGAVPTAVTRRRAQPAWFRFVVRLCRERPLGALGALLCVALLLVGIGADWIAPQGYNAINPIERLQAPSWAHWFGTDQIGRDLFARIVHGARLSVVVAFSATTLSIVISALIGIISGYFGGRLDMTVQRFVDGWMCFPDLILLIVAMSVLGVGKWQIILVLGFVFGVAGSRIVRGAVLSAKQNVYVQAARSMGASHLRIMVYHILPSVMAPLIVLYTTRLAAVILVAASLSFLGLGIPPPAPSWGGMLSMAGRSYMFQAPWLAIFPGIALTLAVFGVNIFGDALRDMLDPRMRGGGGRFFARVRRPKG